MKRNYRIPGNEEAEPVRLKIAVVDTEVGSWLTGSPLSESGFLAGTHESEAFQSVVGTTGMPKDRSLFLSLSPLFLCLASVLQDDASVVR